MPSTESSPFIVRYDPRPRARVRLLCFAHAGGSASAFATWHRSLPPEIEVAAVQLPGRENRRNEPFIADAERLRDALGSALSPLHDRPVALLGYSLGALVAFEYARGLRQRGAPAPAALIVAASRAPHRQIPSNMSQLPRSEFIREIVRRYDGLPQQILDNPELLEMFLPVLRNDLRLVESYRYVDGPPLHCPMWAFGGSEDPRVPRDELEAWATQTEATFSSRVYPGGHFFVTAHRNAFLREITDLLGSVSKPTAPHGSC